MKDLSVVVPIWNESESIAELVARIDLALTNANISYHIILIDNHSTDTTDKIVAALSRKYSIELYQQHSRGKALAIVEGASYVQTEYMVMLDGDLQYPPEAIPSMYFLRTQFPVVVARRQEYKERILRKFLTYGHRLIFNQLLFGFTCDVQSGLKLFPTRVARSLDTSYMSPWTFDLSLLYCSRILDLKIGEVSIVFEDRRNGTSKLSLISSIIEHVISTLKFKLRPPRIVKLK